MQVDEQKGLEGLVVWQKANKFTLDICSTLLPKLPEHEKYALTSQLRRSSQSIAANIAEGYGRYYFQEGVRFAYIARGSLEETRNHLIFAFGMNYLSDDEFEKMNQKIEEIRRLINGYINYLKKSKRGINEPGALYFIRTDLEPITTGESST